MFLAAPLSCPLSQLLSLARPPWSPSPAVVERAACFMPLPEAGDGEGASVELVLHASALPPTQDGDFVLPPDLALFVNQVGEARGRGRGRALL